MNNGFFGIGIENMKSAMNIGTLWRSAINLGADFIFVNRRSSFTILKFMGGFMKDNLKEWLDVVDGKMFTFRVISITETQQLLRISRLAVEALEKIVMVKNLRFNIQINSEEQIISHKTLSKIQEAVQNQN